MDQFFKFLREIQKKERTNSSLSRVGNDFYKRTHSYLDELKTILRNDPFSNEHSLMKETQIIATEICERREHKITDAAVMNIQRSYHIFKGKSKFDLLDTTPLNLTDEEEKLYFSLIDNLKNHRQSISLDKFTDDLEKFDSSENDVISNSTDQKAETKKNSAFDSDDDNKKNYHESKSEVNNNSSRNLNDTNSKNDISNELNKFKKAKIIKNETYESINHQINKNNNKNHDIKNNIANNLELSKDKDEIKSQSNEKSSEIDSINSKSIATESDEIKHKNKKIENDHEINNFFGNEDDQFIDLDNKDLINEIPISNDKSTSKLNKDHNIINKTILIFNKIESIVGVDQKIYGPFYPQDVVMMPIVNANIIIKNNMGRLIKI